MNGRGQETKKPCLARGGMVNYPSFKAFGLSVLELGVVVRSFRDTVGGVWRLE